MRMMSFALGIAVLAAGQMAAGQTAASEKEAVMVPVRQFTEAFNKGDKKAAASTCADQTCIIDEFPPHEWHGAEACAKWFDDYDTDAKKNGITDGFVTLGKPRHIDVTGDRAYFVAPANYTYKKNGKPVKETGSMFTLALHKGEAGWRITGWAWTKN